MSNETAEADPMEGATILDVEALEAEEAGGVSSFGRYHGATEPTDHPVGTEAHLVALEVPDLAEKAVERVRKIHEDERYTDPHKKERAREIGVKAVNEIREEHEKALQDKEGEIDEAEAELRTRTIEPRDPADAAGQLMDQEVRTVLRGMDSAERAKYLLREAPADVLEATLRAPSFLTGIQPDTHESLMERAVERRFSDELADLAQARRNLQAARRAIQNSYAAIKEAVDQTAGGGAT